MYLRTIIRYARPCGNKPLFTLDKSLFFSTENHIVVPRKLKGGVAFQPPRHKPQAALSKNSYGFAKFNEDDDGFEKKKEELLSESMTEELEKEIVGEKVGLKFILKQALSEIYELESRRISMPLPSSMELIQWKELISLTDTRARWHYLDSLLYGEKTFEEIKALDDEMSKPLEVSEEMIAKAVGDDSEARRRIQMFLMRHELMRQEGEQVPFRMRVVDLIEIGGIRSFNGIIKFINFMNITHHKKNVELLKRRRSQSTSVSGKNIKKEEVKECSHIFYGLGHNGINLRIPDTSIKKHADWMAIREFSVGNPLVVDFSYLCKLKNRQMVRGMVQKEATLAVVNNREARTPYALHFTGVDSNIYQLFEKAMAIDKDRSNVPVEITEKSHLDLFPKEKLVYLSPDSRNDLFEYNDDDIYVIGGIIDKGDDRAPLTLASAKSQGIRHARFPMRRTIGLHADLNVETCVAIMNDMKASQDWFYAFRWVPARFFANRVRANDGILNNKLTYRAHKALSPSFSDADIAERNKRLSAKQYRDLYAKVVDCKSHEEMQELLATLKL